MARRTPEEIILDLQTQSTELENKQKAIKAQINAQKKKLREKERKERTKRLIEKGGCIEKVFHVTKEMDNDTLIKFLNDVSVMLTQVNLELTTNGLIKKEN